MLSHQPIDSTDHSPYMGRRSNSLSQMRRSFRNLFLMVVYYVFILPIMLFVLLNPKEDRDFDFADMV